MSDTSRNSLFELQETLYESSNYTRRRLHQLRRQWVNQNIQAFSRNIPLSYAIEYGPGSGVYLPILAENFTKVVAADVEQAYLTGIEPLLGEFPSLSLITDNIMQSRLDSEMFGFVLCSEVIEHIDCPEKAIQTLYRILKPGGIALVTTPQKYSLLELCCKVAFLPGVIQMVRYTYREPVLETGHISLMTSKELEKLLLQSGFNIIESEKFGLYMPLVAEFCGELGGRFIEGFEYKLKNSFFRDFFWTQAYVLQKPY